MWELTLDIIKSGFPLLWIIIGAMILRSIWTRDDERPYQTKWTTIVVGPIILAFLIWVIFRNQADLAPIIGAIAGFAVLLLPFMGIGYWLFVAYRR